MENIFPLEVWLQITTLIQPKDVFALARTSKFFYSEFTSDSVWWPKIQKLWYLSDYDPYKLTHKKRLKHNETCFQYFRRKKNNDTFLKNLITDISENGNDKHIQTRLSKVYSNFQNYIPCLLSETLHLTENLFQNGYICARNFQRIQKVRNTKLDRVYIASNILDSGKQLQAYEFYQKLISEKDFESDLEDVLLHLALFDTRYHELILHRHKILKRTLFLYKTNTFPEGTGMAVRIFFLLSLVQKLINDSAHIVLQSSSQPLLYAPCLEDKSILRYYCGDTTLVGSFKYAILEKITKILGISGVKFNDYCAVLEEHDYLYFILNNGKQTYLRNIDEMPPVLIRFPEKNNDYLAKVFRTFFGKSNSRFADMKGQDQIGYTNIGNNEIVCVERQGTVQGQVLICGGYVNIHNWHVLEDILDNKVVTKTIFNNYILKKTGQEGGHSVMELESTEIWEAANIQIGDIVWSDASDARGVVVEITDSEIGNSTICKNKKGESIKLIKQPLYKIFFGAYGFATFSRQFVKRDISDRVEGLLVYDLIGKWFKTYDYGIHRFIYRHEVI